MQNFQPLKIKEKIQETYSAVSFFFEMPTEMTTNYRFKAGQYVKLETEINGVKHQRPYSLSCSENTKNLKVTIKAIQGGLFSNHACNTLKTHDTIGVSPPTGKFVLPYSEVPQHYLAFVAGSGITPVFSMMTSVLVQCPKSSFTVVYGTKSPEQTIFFKRLHTLTKTYPDRLKIFYAYSQTKKEGAFYGRIDEKIAKEILQKTRSIDEVLLCGPAEMLYNLRRFLEDAHFKPEQIHYELFFDPDAKKTTPTKTEDTPQKIKATVLLDNEEESVSFDKNQTILEGLLESGLDAPHSCKGGVCSSCTARITSGKAEMTKNTLLDEDDITEGLVLTCTAHATTDEISLDFDDV